MDGNKFLVRVSCMTYNHVNYITDAMNGFVIQKTPSPFVCTIVDDASTDGEQDVIRRYLFDNFDIQEIAVAYNRRMDYGEVYFARHNANINCFFAVVLLNENHYSQKKSKMPYLTEWMDAKYVALCDGDDYWTDPLKLQKQVGFLEKHEQYVLCAHNSITLGVNGNMGCFNKWLNKTEFNYEDLILMDWFLPTQSLLYRREVEEKNRIGRIFYNGDYCLQLRLTKGGGLVHYFNECMGVYRTDVGVSKDVSEYDVNLRIIDLLEYMKSLSEERYWKAFEERIKRLRCRNIEIDSFENNKKNGKKLWYRIRFRLLICFAKFLHLKNPEVKIYKNY